MTTPEVNLVADIGGTNIRIGITKAKSQIEHLTVLECRQFQTLYEALRCYINRFNLNSYCINACLAIACPTDNDLVSMTNLPWSFSQQTLAEQLRLNQLFVINDYTAIAHAVPGLCDTQKYQVGSGQAADNMPISICGPGTGLGTAIISPNGHGQWVTINGEGGHVDYAPTDEVELAIFHFLVERFGRASYEQLLSGRGLAHIYQALCQYSSGSAKPYRADQISHLACARECIICEQALARFCKILGSFAGNLALITGSLGGVYTAGGIVPKILPYFAESDFRQRFIAKVPFQDYLANIPTYVITELQPGLLGASIYLHQSRGV